MPFAERAGLRYFAFELFPPDLVQGVFTRRGGVSPEPWASLNVGATVGDEAMNVRENRVRSFRVLGRQIESMFDVWQVHSADVAIVNAPRGADEGYRKADVILTNRPEVTLYMRFADCVPVLLYDPVRAAIGMVHAGWLGTVRGAAKAAIEAMTSAYGSEADDILAAIGPSIGPDHYEVGAEVQEQFKVAFGSMSGDLFEVREGRLYLDLWAANALQLRQSGVRRIAVAGVCTACHNDDWFSHRAEKGKTGRFGALIALPGQGP